MAYTASLTTMSQYLTSGFWNYFHVNGRSHAYDISDSGSKGVIKFNVSGYSSDGDGLTAGRRELVRDAFKYLENVTGIDFQETTERSGSAQSTIYFSDNQPGAYGGSGYNPQGVAYNGRVNIASNWIDGSNAPNNYVMQTILHEIGHALGLGHQGPYNGSQGDPIYTNDTWQNSIMSYHSQPSGGSVAGGSGAKASYAYVQTMMAADLLALQQLYGTQSYSGKTFGLAQAFSGNTVYGFGTNISSAEDPILSKLATYGAQNAYTIIDGGGIDTFNFSGWTENQWINLTPTNPNSAHPTVSNIGGTKVGNLALAAGTIIENAIGGSGHDSIIGNHVNNNLTGNAGHDWLYGNDGDDRLYGGSGNDNLYGGNGDDYLRDDAGTDHFYGGAGSDTVSYYGARGGVSINLQTGRNNGGDTYSSIENVTGSRYAADNITGSNGANILRGSGGNDKLYGLAGNDILAGGSGSDLLDGGSGTDFVTYYGNSSGVTVNLQTGRNSAGDTYVSIENVAGSKNGADNITGSSAANNLRGHGGNDRLYGLDGNDQLTGSQGNDILYGQNHNDRLYGGANDDFLDGGAGNDVLNGGTGNDKIYGGTGADTFVFSNGFDRDTIADFDTRQAGERINLDKVTSITSFTDLKANHLYASGNSSVIDAGNGDVLTLTNVLVNTLTTDDFLF